MAPTDRRRITYEQRNITRHALAHAESSEVYFAIYDDAFLHVLGDSPNMTLLFEKDYQFAHEAPVYDVREDAVYFTSNVRRLDGGGGDTAFIDISKITRQSDQTWKMEKIPTGVAMGNGAINYREGILYCDQGSLNRPGGIVYMETSPPYETRTLVDGFHGRMFNSVNDVVTHTDGSIWFTDPTYGHDQEFRGKPVLPCQTYRFDPSDGDLRVVSDGLRRPNGLCFSPDEKTLYITDTDHVHIGDINPTRPGTIYAFDVIERHGGQFLANQRVFAMADTTIPDGIKCDTNGLVYSGCGDGVNVWLPSGKLIGKFVIPGGVANFCFTRRGEMVALNEKRLWLIHFDRGTHGALLANLNIDVP